MSNDFLRDIFEKMIEEKKKEGPFIRNSSLFYVMDAVYNQKQLEILFKEYLKTKSEDLYVALVHKAQFSGISMFRILENNDLPPELIFTVDALEEESHKLTQMMIYVEEKTPTLEEVMVLNKFLVDNLMNIHGVLTFLGYEIKHRNDEDDLKIEAWWKDRLSKDA